MNIQSISVVVPTKGCVNKCKFCVSRMHDNPYENHFDEIQIRKRIKYAANNGVNTLILTGTGEALQNKAFLTKLANVLDKEHHPFPNVELQTSGVMLMDQNEFGEFVNVSLLKRLGVNTISLSVSDIFDSPNNWRIIGSPAKYRPSLSELCGFIKENHFNIRLSLNMTNVYDEKSPEQILRACKSLGADQITFRKLYHSDDNSPQTQWVKENACDYKAISKLELHITGKTRPTGKTTIGSDPHGKPLYRLPFGAMVYSIMGMSVAIDDDCMSKNEIDSLKYVILRENGKLYCQWDDEGSLIF
jgi:hypothetical protein